MKESISYSFLIADDQSIARQGSSVVIKELFFNAKIYHSGLSDDIFGILNKNRIDLLILEINWAIGDGLEIIKAVKKVQDDIKILIFTVCDENIYAVRYLNAGASGYLSKDCTLEEMNKALSFIMMSGKYVTQNVKCRILDNYIFNRPINPLDQLSSREVEVARLLINGHSNSEITNLMHIKKSTVSTLKKRIFEKLEINNLAALIEFFKLYFRGITT